MENNKLTTIASPKLPTETRLNNKQETKKGEDGKRSDSVIALEKELLRTSWVKEAELIKDYVPEEDLTKTQQKLLEKCINKEEFTEKQIADLKLLLNKYRKILLKIKPDQTVKQVDDAVQMMESERDFINMMTTDEQMTLLVHVKTINGVKGFNFIIHPINDSRVIETLEMQVDLFRDYSVDEQTIYSKASIPGQKLTLEEQRIYDKMNKEILAKQSIERIHTINSFLAHQLSIKNSTSTYDDRLRFWEVFPFNSKVGVFLRVQDMLGLSETKNSELFPSG